jgi:hypothetical protein
LKYSFSKKTPNLLKRINNNSDRQIHIGKMEPVKDDPAAEKGTIYLKSVMMIVWLCKVS